MNRFKGLHCYHGALQHIRDQEKMAEQVADVCVAAKSCVTMLESHGIACPIVTGGGTGMFFFCCCHSLAMGCESVVMLLY
jgi:D-serine deaminase-like pyridoxal phosphate-dependent protein